jgi:release factor glutamine methyltransferase
LKTVLATSIGALIKESAIPQRETTMLLGRILQISRASIAAHPERFLDAQQEHLVHAWIQRRVAGEPMAYILGEREFYGVKLIVTPDVLIPRPETETLVEQALARLSRQYAPNTARVLDLGTGSGAIAISLAEQRPALDIVATDISAKALAVAKENAKRLGVQISFIESDWFAALKNERFDLIFSNPPYVAHGDPHLTEGDLRFEPITALTDNEPNQGGLACIRHIIENAPKHLNGEGWLLFEHGYDQADACRELLAARGFVELMCAHDLAGIPRVSGGRWPAVNKI